MAVGFIYLSMQMDWDSSQNLNNKSGCQTHSQHWHPITGHKRRINCWMSWTWTHSHMFLCLDLPQWWCHSDDVTVMMSQQCAGTYSCAGCSLFGLFCEERQHQLHLLFLLLTDVVRVCRRTTHSTEWAAHTSYHHSSCHRFSTCVPPVLTGGYEQKFKSSQNWKQRLFLKLCFTKDTLICCN